MRKRALQVSEAHGVIALAEFLVREAGVSATLANDSILTGAVYVDGRRCQLPKRELKPGQRVLFIEEEHGRSTAEAGVAVAALDVLFESHELIAVNKPPGITTQPTPGRVGESLSDQVSARLGRPAGIVHRLDRETSGVVVFGKTPGATRLLAQEFRGKNARKLYLAVTGPGLPADQDIDLPLSRDPSRPGRQRASRQANGVDALTGLRRLYAGPDYALAALYPRTGRTHQLRAHLTAVGAPILGDTLYGGAARAGDLSASRVLLHARALLLPSSGAPPLEAPVPEDIRVYFDQARVEPPDDTTRER